MIKLRTQGPMVYPHGQGASPPSKARQQGRRGGRQGLGEGMGEI